MKSIFQKLIDKQKRLFYNMCKDKMLYILRVGGILCALTGGENVAQMPPNRYNRIIYKKQGVDALVWVCIHCGHRLEREGYTEICPNCWQPSMRKEDDAEQYAPPADQNGDQGATEGQAGH